MTVIDNATQKSRYTRSLPQGYARPQSRLDGENLSD